MCSVYRLNILSLLPTGTKYGICALFYVLTFSTKYFYISLFYIHPRLSPGVRAHQRDSNEVAFS